MANVMMPRIDRKRGEVGTALDSHLQRLTPGDQLSLAA
jgi:hypothetical protein